MKKYIYCGWLNFRGVPIFVVFVEGPIHEFQCQRNSDFSVWIMKENTMTTNFETHECLIFFWSTKIGTHEDKAIHSMKSMQIIE